MTRTHPGRIVVTICAVTALLALSVLPTEHLHHESTEAAFVHRHVVDAIDHIDDIDDGAWHDGPSLDHGDHSAAKSLNPSFDSPRRYDVTRSLSSAQLFVGGPDLRCAVRLDRVDDPPTHGPPIRSRSLRGPPA